MKFYQNVQMTYQIAITANPDNLSQKQVLEFLGDFALFDEVPNMDNFYNYIAYCESYSSDVENEEYNLAIIAKNLRFDYDCSHIETNVYKVVDEHA